ncbi:hypothetical protein Godav_004559 [Gossypium davidsonii]|uniref:SWIM-type domain-containing protein n=1 Tax=Gossypium davidsonii TaxID=34287 RepID=A0A7J8SN21_GOSDV|nr:hypothetical protein [Gossypium davidsonii]
MSYEAMIAIQKYNRINNDNQRNKRKLKTNGGDEIGNLEDDFKSNGDLDDDLCSAGFDSDQLYTESSNSDAHLETIDELSVRKSKFPFYDPNVRALELILGLDGCYLKGIAKGELLTVVTRDANNQMFPLAWCFVKVKSTTSWTWFLEILKRDIGTPDGYGWTFISDQQKLLNNYSHMQSIGFVLDMYGQIGLEKVRMGSKEKMAVVALLDVDETRFCKAYFSYNTKCDSTYNNLAKAFNASIVQARSKPIISTLNDIRAKLDKSIKESTKWNVHFNGDYGYEIMCGRITYIVDLERMTCSYRLRDFLGIPCAHIVCVIYNKEDDPEKYLAKCYSKEMYMRTNEYDLQPINGSDL